MAQQGRRQMNRSARAAARFARMAQGRRMVPQRRTRPTPQPRASIWRGFMQRNGLRELANIALITLAYFVTRGLIRGREGDAFANAYTLISMERTLGLYHEMAWQQFALGHRWLIDFVNNYYLYGHLPLLVGVAAWLFWWRPSYYAWIRNGFILSAALGLLIYVSVPMAPPRFLPGYVDTMKVYGFDVDGSAAGPLYNPYAAMPSLHTGWAVLSGFAIFVASRRWWNKALGIILPSLMVVSVVLTGNHFFLDAVVGTAVVALALTLAWGFEHNPWVNRQVARQHVTVR